MTDYGFVPNFSCEYSIEIAKPVSEVMLAFDNHERVCRLSKLCTGFELLELDTVSIPESKSLSQTSFRTQPKPLEGETAPGDQAARSLPRQSFKMVETIPLLFGLIKKDVRLSGCITLDNDNKIALYESILDSGVQIWKLREFHELEEGKTRVKEIIQGRCPPLLRPIVQREAATSHCAHMDAFQTLFD
ncbi:hypothetical protein C8J56DRAFT_779706 [Mycena floridula]|nr:hypothetical protein C8J56DRAFT_779706 [Mycena floridula]